LFYVDSLAAVKMILSDATPEAVFVFLALFIVCFICYWCIVGIENTSRPILPPAIRSFPVIGSVLFLPQHEELHKWFLDNSDSLGYLIGFYAGRR